MQPAPEAGSDAKGGIARPSKDYFFVGCSALLISAILGLVVGWSVWNHWLGIALMLPGWFLGMWIFTRISRSNGIIEFGCVSLLLTVFIAMLIPASLRIRQAAERIRAEREQKSNTAPATPSNDK